ncbi:TPA: ATP-dependent helicase [Enterobacter asburiae]|jgi:superfamily I DNA/RNA helicase|nr:ATP-dependent helicase [Salmonella enterica subsp. enterica serovar Saintpaul]HCR2014723.1 ATP-dependent helicase [Enterobacter asburiae]HCR2022495.1 ATP-dependent helicase [Enterobacter asburiae]HCR2027273.1 ATP-dependent helicase [Enterobacter asburiae]HCR2032911.1 ATP-dependent helicase [Enterobacter asburiae]
MNNELILAVAGSRKTQGIIDHCAKIDGQKRVLVLTFTQFNQNEIRNRLSHCAGNSLHIEVLGWYTFLIRHFAKPFLPYKFPGQRILGFNFDGRPYMMAKGINRFLDKNNHAYACELARLSAELINASQGALIFRLESIYDEILIDEVQDLSGYDLDILDSLLATAINLKMVGDMRQAVLSTNPRGSKHKKYQNTNMLSWFLEREEKGIIKIIERFTTWRCHHLISDYADTIFSPEWGFPKTKSENHTVTCHDGVFLVMKEHVEDYIKTFKPQCLRNSKSSGKAYNFDFINFKASKGSTFERILIIPTSGIETFIQKNEYLESTAAATFYVAVTRAQQSVAIVVGKPGQSNLPIWKP